MYATKPEQRRKLLQGTETQGHTYPGSPKVQGNYIMNLIKIINFKFYN